MKLFSILGSIALLMVFSSTTSAQKCYIPKPMTTPQIEQVKGVWAGYYKLDGKEFPITVKLYTDSKVTCSIEGSPVNGKETGEQMRFCDGGEFHIKKMVGDLSYEFQGTPKENHIEGLLTVRNNDVKVGNNGRFQLTRKS